MHISGEWISEKFYMKPTKVDPQAYGSVITYQRRYALSAILGLNTDSDDDGNKASEEPELIDSKTYQRIEFLIHNSTYEEETKDKLFKNLQSLTMDKAEEAIQKLELSQKSIDENENMTQSDIQKKLDLIDKDEKK